MRKLLYSIGAIVLTAAAVFIWSHTALVPIKASTGSVAALSGVAASSQGTASVSPTEMMINHKPALPTENWEPF